MDNSHIRRFARLFTRRYFSGIRFCIAPATVAPTEYRHVNCGRNLEIGMMARKTIHLQGNYGNKTGVDFLGGTGKKRRRDDRENGEQRLLLTAASALCGIYREIDLSHPRRQVAIHYGSGVDGALYPARRTALCSGVPRTHTFIVHTIGLAQYGVTVTHRLLQPFLR